jgi:hypothetical protein
MEITLMKRFKLTFLLPLLLLLLLLLLRLLLLLVCLQTITVQELPFLRVSESFLQIFWIPWPGDRLTACHLDMPTIQARRAFHHYDRH